VTIPAFRLPPYRYIKDRSVSDYTYSAHADGYDDCLHDIMALLDAAGISYDKPDCITTDELRGLGLLETDE
jgi:hypothetical protein